MATQVPSKYYLKSLHEEIALFDRKLAHLLRYETFPSEKDRNAAAAKMSVKRGQLVKTAQKLAEEGIEFATTDVPRSMRPEDVTPVAATQEVSFETASVDPTHTDVATRLAASPFRDEILAFVAKRKKTRDN